MTAEEKAKSIRIGVSASCGVIPQLTDLLAVTVHPGFMGVSATIRFICEQVEEVDVSFLASGLLQNVADNDDCIAIVNGVCIRAEGDDD